MVFIVSCEHLTGFTEKWLFIVRIWELVSARNANFRITHTHTEPTRDQESERQEDREKKRKSKIIESKPFSMHYLVMVLLLCQLYETLCSLPAYFYNFNTKIGQHDKTEKEEKKNHNNK